MIGTPEEGVNTMQDVYLRNSKKFGDNNFIGTREALEDGNLGKYVFKTHSEIFATACNLGSGLRGMNLIQKDQETGCELLSIFGPNSEPWYVTDIAGMLHGITLAPLYNTLGPDTIKYVLN